MPGDIKNILVTGACGQIGTELVPALRNRYGAENVIASDIKSPETGNLAESEPFYYIDVTKPDTLGLTGVIRPCILPWSV